MTSALMQPLMACLPRLNRIIGVLMLCTAAYLSISVSALAPASAQEFQMREVIARMNRLEKDLAEVQRQFYRGAPRTAPAPAGRAGLTTTQAAELSVRISQLETELRTLTGSVEKVDFTIGRLRQRLDKLVADVDFRLTAIERELAKRPARGDVAAGQVTPAPGLSPGSPSAGQVPAAALRSPGAGSQSLGTLPADAAGRPKTDIPKAVLPKGVSPKEQYNFAFKLLRQGDFGDAEKAFREFLAVNGGHELAGNAQYWLGESFYVRGNYNQAARAFLEGYQKYQKNAKAPDSLLKLGMSLAQMGQKKEACAALLQLATEFPQAPDYVKRQAGVEAKRAGCK